MNLALTPHSVPVQPKASERNRSENPEDAKTQNNPNDSKPLTSVS